MSFSKDVRDIADVEKNGDNRNVFSSASSIELDSKLATLGEENPYYVHDLVWTEEEERQIVRIFDFKILSWTCVMYFLQVLDSGNISNALTDNLLNDIGIDINTFTLGKTLFTLTYVFFEIPSNMVLNRLGAHRWLPFLVTTWGLATAAQVFLHDKVSFLICRAFVGLFEAGNIPGVNIYLTTYYKRTEMAFRLSIFWSVASVSRSLAGVIAYGILHMRGIAGLAGWKWLFLLEGLLTVLFGIILFFILPEGPTRTKGYLRFNGYLTERQEQIAVTRLIRDDPSKIGGKRGFIPIKDILKAFTSNSVWPNSLIAFFALMPTVVIGTFKPYMFKEFGFDPRKSNLMNIPAEVLSLCLTIIFGYSSDKFKDRAFHGAVNCIIYASGVLALAILPLGTDKNVLYIVIIIAFGFATCWNPVNSAWLAENTVPAGKRSIGLAIYFMIARLSVIPGANLFRNEWAPRFIPSMRILAGSLVLAALLFLLQRVHLAWHNKRRERITKHWTEADWEHYNATTTDYGDSRLDFRYTL